MCILSISNWLYISQYRIYRWNCYLFKCQIHHPFVPTISPEFSHISLESTSSGDKKPRFPWLHISLVKPFSAFCSTQENVFHTRIYTRWVQCRNWFTFLWEPVDCCLPFILKCTKGVLYPEWQGELSRTCINVKMRRAARGDSKTSVFVSALLVELSVSGQFCRSLWTRNCPLLRKLPCATSRLVERFSVNTEKSKPLCLLPFCLLTSLPPGREELRCSSAEG